MKGGDGRWLSSPRPRTRVSGSAAHGGRRLPSRSRSPPSTPAACLTAPRRPAGVSRLFPVRLFRSVPLLGCGARPVPPRRGKGSAPRRRPAPPSRRGSRARVPDGAGVVRGGATGRVGAAAVLPPASSTPRPLSGYLATAFRRVGLKTPGGVASPSPGSGGRRGPSGAVDVRRLPRTPVPHAAGGRSRGAPPRSWVREPPLGRPWGSPPRARFAGASSVAGPVSVGPDPLSSCFFPCLAGRPEANPSPFPRRLSPGAAGGEGGLCRRQLSSERKNARTTLSGGSLGSCVDEERS